MGHNESRSKPDSGMSILCDAHNHQLPDADAGIDGDDVLVIGEERIDVDLLDLRGEAEEGGETHDNLSILLFVEAFLSSGALDDLITSQGVDHRIGSDV